MQDKLQEFRVIDAKRIYKILEQRALGPHSAPRWMATSKFDELISPAEKVMGSFWNMV